MRLAIRTGVLALFVAAGLTPLPSLRASPEQGPQKLAETTNVHAAGPSVATVGLPKNVRFWHPLFDPNRADFRIEGGSGFAVFALMRTDPGAPPAGILGGRLPEEAGSEPFLTHVGLGPTGPSWTGYWELPQGRYRLYVFTEELVRLTLSFEGLSGRRTVVASDPARYEVEEPAPLVDPGPYTNLYSAGASGTLKGTVAQLQVLWTRESAHLSSQTGFCWYDGAPPEPTTAYAPGCPFADSQDVVEVTGTFVGDSLWVATGLRLPVPTGKSGQGMWFASAAAVREVGHVTVWLDLGLDPGRGS